MRGAFLVGIIIVLLIIGILLMKNMGYDSKSRVSKTQAETYIERAEDTAEHVEKKVKRISDQLNGANEQ